MIKRKIKQLFCRHKRYDFYVKQQIYHALNGERVYRICNDCGKILDSKFWETEAFYRTFRISDREIKERK